MYRVILRRTLRGDIWGRYLTMPDPIHGLGRFGQAVNSAKLLYA